MYGIMKTVQYKPGIPLYKYMYREMTDFNWNILFVFVKIKAYNDKNIDLFYTCTKPNLSIGKLLRFHLNILKKELHTVSQYHYYSG